MTDRSRITRRAALGLIATGGILSIAQTHSRTSTSADRSTTLSTEPDPSAYLGITGIGQDPHNEVSVVNNTGSVTLEVTVSTTDFTIANDGDGGSDTQWTFQLSPGTDQPVQFSPETENTDDVSFTGKLLDGGTQSGTIDLTRSVTIPASPGNTYRIKSVHSDLYLTGDTPSGGAFAEGSIYQDNWTGSDSQRWLVDTDGGANVIEPVASGALLSLEFFNFGGGDVTDVVTRDATGGGPGDDQRWNLTQYADETYRVENVDNGDVLDVEGESTSAGGNVITYPDKGNTAPVANQKWVFDPL